MAPMRLFLDGPLLVVEGTVSPSTPAISVKSSLFLDVSIPENGTAGPLESHACLAAFAASLALAFRSAFSFCAASNCLNPSPLIM